MFIGLWSDCCRPRALDCFVCMHSSDVSSYWIADQGYDGGLTTGSREAAEVALTELGRTAVYPSCWCGSGQKFKHCQGH